MGRKAVVLIFIGVLLAVMAMTSTWRLAGTDVGRQTPCTPNSFRPGVSPCTPHSSGQAEGLDAEDAENVSLKACMFSITKPFSCLRSFITDFCARLAGTDSLTLNSDTAGKAYNHNNLIRLHIIANSNDPGDQALKYRVRDAIITAFSPELLKLHSRDEAEKLLAADQGKIARLAEQVIDANGRAYPARVVIGDFDFPTRAYGDLVLPAGNYRAVRVILGQGAGANWWCVLYPPLCFVDAAASGIRTGEAGKDSGAALANGPAQLPPAQEQMNPVVGGGSVRLRLRVLDWLDVLRIPPPHPDSGLA